MVSDVDQGKPEASSLSPWQIPLPRGVRSPLRWREIRGRVCNSMKNGSMRRVPDSCDEPEATTKPLATSTVVALVNPSTNLPKVNSNPTFTLLDWGQCHCSPSVMTTNSTTYTSQPEEGLCCVSTDSATAGNVWTFKQNMVSLAARLNHRRLPSRPMLP